jgi:HD-GYP domain-containing protein (c-di-GMP phosphodiesterase class II)
MLYLVPVYVLAAQMRLRGGLIGAAIAGVASLAGDAFLAPDGSLGPQITLAIYGQLLLLLVVGGLVGRGAQRERHLVDGLVESYRRLEQDLERVVLALTGALEEKDVYTEGHLQRVKSYALEVGRRLGLGERDLALLHIAATLHDIGKIGIPEHILNKPGPLGDEEREVMQRHPEIGARILARLDGLKDAAPIVLHHQERWDGRRDGPFPGYPAGLAGEEIPLGSRIIAVVDTFDALATTRPYRRALPVARAGEVLRSERGRQFDPQVVDTFLEVLAAQPWGAA